MLKFKLVLQQLLKQKRMRNFLKIILCLSVMIYFVHGMIRCPSQNGIKYQSFNSLNKNLKEFDLWKNKFEYYKMRLQPTGQYLYRYYASEKIPQIQGAEVVSSISMNVPVDSLLITFSNEGNCVCYLNNKMIYFYETSTGQFVKKQQFDFSALNGGLYVYPSDDCSVARLVNDDTGAATINILEVKDSAVVRQEQFVLNPFFEKTLTYAIDENGNFYDFSTSTYTKMSFPEIKKYLYLFQWSEKLNVLIALTADDSTFTLAFIDPVTKAVVYSKTYETQVDYVGNFEYILQPDTGLFFATDDVGLVDYIRFYKSGSSIKQTSYTLDKQQFDRYFVSDAHISISEGVIFIYFEKDLLYFQQFEGKIYLLNIYATDIEKKSEDQIIKKRGTITSEIILTVIEPVQLQTCDSAIPVSIPSSAASLNQLSTPFVVDPDTGLSVRCPSNCLTCKSSEECSICVPSYTLTISGKCIPCQGCLICSSDDTSLCFECLAPKLLDPTTNKCVAPQCLVQNCLQCDLTGKCIKCLDGHGFTDGTCVECQVNGCKSCSADATSCDIDQCKSGYIYYQDPDTKKGICQPCTVGIDVCLATDLSQALICSMGNYIQKDSQGVNRCLNCFDYCQKCSNSTVCQSCFNGYIPSSDGKACVQKCSIDCLTCDQTNVTKCLSCFAGSTLDPATGTCVDDSACSDTSSCLFCGKSSVLDQGKCNQCTYTDQNCVGCSATDTQKCTGCKIGYFLQNNNCVKCVQGCFDCLGLQSCVRCSNGYFLLKYENADTGVCKPCDSKCKTCSGTPTLCTSCVEGMILEKSKCISNDNKVEVQLLMQADLSNYIEFMGTMLDFFVSESNKGQQSGSQPINQQSIAVRTISKSSSQSMVDVAISTDGKGDNLKAIGQSLNNALSSKPIFKGYQVVSSSVTYTGSQSGDLQGSNNLQQQQGISASSLGLILGISIPIGILIVAGCFCCFFVILRRRIRDQKTESIEPQKDLSEFRIEEKV